MNIVYAYPWYNISGGNIPDSRFSNKPYSYEVHSFNYVNLTGVPIIGKEAFYSVKALREVYIYDTTTTISDYAFYNCYSLVKV